MSENNKSIVIQPFDQQNNNSSSKSVTVSLPKCMFKSVLKLTVTGKA
jgi:hypothetical protein